MITQVYGVFNNEGGMGDRDHIMAYFDTNFEAEEYKNKQKDKISYGSIRPLKAIKLPNGDCYLLGDKIKVTT